MICNQCLMPHDNPYLMLSAFAYDVALFPEFKFSAIPACARCTGSSLNAENNYP